MESVLSNSEENGLRALLPTDLQVYSIGISTAGVAEIRMAEANPDRHIIATTIDEQGIQTVKEQIIESSVHSQIEVKFEDISQPLPYKDETFDFIYARLVLHYLSRQVLETTLREIYRVLKTRGRLFIVVRSTLCFAATDDTSTYDPETSLTSYFVTLEETGLKKVCKRFFHSETSISNFVKAAGFKPESVSSYDEQLFYDFNRTKPAHSVDNLIELIVSK